MKNNVPEYLLFAVVNELPESANRIWRLGNGHQYKSAKAKAWQAYAAEIFRAHRFEKEPYEGDVYYQVNIYFKGNNTQDLDNRLKQIGDALICKPKNRNEPDRLYAGIIVDDSQIKKIIAEKRYAAKGEKARIEIAVWKHKDAGVKVCKTINDILNAPFDDGNRGKG